MFEWQKHSLKSEGVPHYLNLLEFLNLRVQATESTITDGNSKRVTHAIPYAKKTSSTGGMVASHATNADSIPSQCILCKPDKHPLYACPRFEDMPHEAKIATIKSNGLCINCFASNHFVKQCKSVHCCKRCQRLHHMLLHVDSTPVNSTVISQVMNPAAPPFTPQIASAPQNDSQNDVVSSNTAIRLKSNSLLMICRILVSAPDGTSVETRALLDNASSASFVSERLTQSLRLPRVNQKARITGVADLSHHSSNQSLANFSISPIRPPFREIDVMAIVGPKVTCDLPFFPIPLKKEWNHLDGVDLADPGFGCPGRIDVLLGVDVFAEVMHHGRRSGPPGIPIAFETCFGWVLAGSTESCSLLPQVTTCHVLFTTGDEALQKFWEMEEGPLSETTLSPEEGSAVQHFKTSQTRNKDG